MNYFLVGNGFDLNHKFPTRYIDFLHTVQFLIKHKSDKFDTVGEVLGSKELTELNPFIKECYEKHRNIYNSTYLDEDTIQNIISSAEDNMWFKYFCNCTPRNIGWIDFEKEILNVLEMFERFFDVDDFFLCNGVIAFDSERVPENVEDKFILSQFKFILDFGTQVSAGTSRVIKLKDNYCIEKVVGSSSFYLNVDEIVSDLYKSLRVLADVLRKYLFCFVDLPAKEYLKMGIKPKFIGLPTPNRVYSFNYTNVFEELYENPMIDHIHGNTNSNIVLGVNPDMNDEIGTIDTTFLQFKKYFQRAFYKTDLDFLDNIKNQRNSRLAFNNDIRLYVIGHSLDSTDEDLITQIFDISDEILILYHDDISVKNQIKNLVNIYGKEGFDKLREEKELMFLPQSDVKWIFPE